jgi:hypothetical protein
MLETFRFRDEMLRCDGTKSLFRRFISLASR